MCICRQLTRCRKRDSNPHDPGGHPILSCPQPQTRRAEQRPTRMVARHRADRRSVSLGSSGWVLLPLCCPERVDSDHVGAAALDVREDAVGLLLDGEQCAAHMSTLSGSSFEESTSRREQTRRSDRGCAGACRPVGVPDDTVTKRLRHARSRASAPRRARPRAPRVLERRCPARERGPARRIPRSTRSQGPTGQRA
jgi:hypothetical protein